MTIDDDERWRWAEASAIQRIHGDDAPRWIAERIGALGMAGDETGVERFRRIARCHQTMLTGTGSAN